MLVLLASSCVIPYEIPLPSNTKYLVVEATLTDIDVAQTVRINETNNVKDNIYNSPVKGLQVEIIVNKSETVNLTEQEPGVYALPFSFRSVPGNIYQLRFRKADGTTYESSEEKTTKAPPIEKVFDTFEAAGLEGTFNDIPANYVFLNFKDNPATTDYYVWTWKLWENQTICRTDYYDFYCNAKCWEIVSNKDFNILSDVYSNGKEISGKLVAKIPLYSFDGALLEIRQNTLSEKAFKYFKLVSEQQQTNGTLVDTPPAAIIGNIKNVTNPNEPVTGVFAVASTVIKKYWLNRENGYGKAIPIGLLGRKPYLSTFPVTYPCTAGPTRTPQKPEGWVD